VTRSLARSLALARAHKHTRLQSIEPVHCDQDRERERERAEHSGGRDMDVYGEQKDFCTVMAKLRARCAAHDHNALPPSA
jgi:hypothetical protein